MFSKPKLNIVFAVVGFFIFSFLFIQLSVGIISLADIIKFEFSNKETLKINASLINPAVKTLAADPANKLIMKVEVRDSEGFPVPKANISLSLEGQPVFSGNFGKLSHTKFRTDENGEFLFTYVPPELGKDLLANKQPNIEITAKIDNTNIKASQTVKLVKPPVVFLHGYQAYAAVFENFGEFLKAKGFAYSALDYKSSNGVIEAAEKLDEFLQKQKMIYLSKGFQVDKFDLVAHSMGGLVARYYTCSERYIANSNVRKIIFISVPQKGSPWASVGATYFNDQGIRDLVPENFLLSKALPSMINKGLNSSIQTGSILGQYDEVVSPESASLEEWNIKTDLFSLGDNNLNFDNLLKGNFNESTNHMSILSNKKVFEMVERMLYDNLPYPIIKKK
ncbi:MAG: alpha/beta hydrolase [Clostridia bacterium]|nr:alpha/beta hydrolase [Clostridia bacterium]